VIAAAAHRDLSGRGSWWSAPVLVHLGRLSFAFYLLQWPIIESLARVHGAGEQPWGRAALLALVALVLTLLAAELAHRLVERPAERWLRGGR
jgi:peptidoglycan/LPS O-acetylase OafA/YrhL